MYCHIFAIIDHEGVPGEYSLNQREAEYGHWQQKREYTHKPVAGPGHEGGIKLHWNYLLPVFGPLSQPQYVVVLVREEPSGIKWLQIVIFWVCV